VTKCAILQKKWKEDLSLIITIISTLQGKNMHKFKEHRRKPFSSPDL
jgi:hypothetical protein